MKDDVELLKHMTVKKIFSLLGLGNKAGYIASGEFSTEKSVKDGRAELVIVASDASDNTKKMFTNMCAFYEVPIYFFGEKTELGHAIGKEFRASLSVNDRGMAQAIEKHLKSGVFEVM
ncbi:L7Ae/L30e/S12e/Gadd45 family ribosomal protein [Clostridium sp. Marseille-P299]|uniref:L7Ae/L30e/S12e/Gadd45 family ribosomal protein n=1 Tax=Clostridium sp. Marseille-P299 TaxID=1805477 RepID=UPI000A7A5B56|nr:ribosomal L7Ae/L30e/S12e/Gadd45 family protein [Clostridium sp. Marseille-P299]